MTAVAADVSLRQFTSTVELSHLLGEEHIAEFHSWCNEHPAAAAVDAAHWLIEQGWTTRWQGQQLVAGHHSFFLRHYKLVSRLGGGGMGTVFQAIDDRTGRLVAVKVIRKSAMQKANALERFRREVAALGKLRHPNIVAAYEAGQLGAYHYLVMEYIEGRDLGHWIAKLKRLPIDMACEIARQVALGLEHAHKLGFIHRDVKPSNLIAVRKSNGELDVRILDFGLARSFDGTSDEARVTRAGQIVGTVDYLAPEQAQGSQNVDGRADIYSLGVTLFEMIAGRTPYTGDTMMARLVARVTQKAPSIAEFAPDATPALASLLEKALEFDPSARFATAGEFAAGLERVINQSSTTAMAATVEMTAMEGGDDSTKVRTPDASMPAFDDFQQALEEKAGRASDSQQMAVPRWLGPNKYWLAGAAGVLVLLLMAVAAKLMRNPAKADSSMLQSTAVNAVVVRLKLEAGSLAEKPDPVRIQRLWKDIWAHAVSVGDDSTRQAARLLSATAPHPLDATFPAGEVQRTVHKPGFFESMGSAKRSKRLAFSPDGRTLASLGERSVVLHDLVAHSSEELTHEELKSPSCLAFNGDGQVLAVGLRDGSVQLWEMNGRTHARCLIGQRGMASNVAFLADGARLVSTHAPRTFALWNLADSAKVEREFELTHSPATLTPLPIGERFLIGGFEGRTTVLDAKTGPFQMTTPHQVPIVGAEYTPDGRHVVVLGNEAVCWRIEESNFVQQWSISCDAGSKWTGSWSSPWLERLALLTTDGSVQLRSWRTGEIEWRLDAMPKSRQAAALAVSPDGRFAAVQCREGGIELVKLPPFGST